MAKKKKTTEPRLIPASPVLEQRLTEMFALEDEIATLEEQLKDKKGLLKTITENEIAELAEPEMFEKGVIVTVGQSPDKDLRGFRFERAHYCGIKKDDKNAAHAWIEEKGFGAMLQRVVSVSLPKDSREIALKVQNLLRQMAPHMEIRVVVDRGSERLPDLVAYVLAEVGLGEMKIEEETVLPGPTLSSFVAKQLEAGAELPAFLNVYSPVTATPVEIPAELLKAPEEVSASSDAAS